jgi:hypothetical protein
MDVEYFADQPFQRPNNCQEHGENDGDDDDDNSGSAL